MEQFSRCDTSPMLAPTENWWEYRAVFNPAAAYDGTRVHILYRAIGEDNISRMGYATSADGFTIEYRSELPVFEFSENVELERLGVEDPRIVRLDDWYYITYVSASVYPASHPRPAFSRGAPWKTRVCLARTQDFRSFERFGAILPDQDDKDGALFDGKVNGRYALLHRIFPDIKVCFSDDMVHWTDDQFLFCPRPDKWDSNRLGAGPSPVLTEKGWLMIYHATDADLVYRMGIALLDKDDPTKVLYRSEEPCLEPETEWEKLGLVPNVVFGCGLVEMDGKYIMYYGAADCTVGAAWVDKQKLLESLI